MDPARLYSLMHGGLRSKESKEDSIPKSKLEKEFDKEISTYVDGLMIEDDTNQKTLLDPKLRREKIKLEWKNELKLQEASQEIDVAIELLISEGSRYLSSEAYQELLSDLANAIEFLADIGIEESRDKNPQSLAKVSDESMKGINDIAAAKFHEGQYENSLALFYFLSLLNSSCLEYWFRFGIAAQKSEKFDLASRAYAAALAIDPNYIGARLFAAECFLQRNLNDEARAELEAAKTIAKTIEVDKMWLDLIPAIESLVNKT